MTTPTIAVPERTLSQRMTALSRANEIRTKRAALKRDLKAGRASIHVLLLNPPEYLETAKVLDVLVAVPKYGRVKVTRVLQTCRISPSKTVGGLSERQRAELISRLQPTVYRNTNRDEPDGLTDFEADVLGFACERGSVGPAQVDAAARHLHLLTTAPISRARRSLARRGMLDEFDAPTAAGRAYHAGRSRGTLFYASELLL